MSIEQYRVGVVRTVTGSTVVTGSVTNWANGNVQESHKFKIRTGGYQAYTVATVLAATRLRLSTTYKEASTNNASYIITRSFTPYRDYARTYQGDYHAADVIRDQIVNPIDTDIGKIYNGSASLDGVRLINGAHYWDIGVNATGQMQFSYKGVKKAYVATVTGTWIEV